MTDAVMHSRHKHWLTTGPVKDTIKKKIKFIFNCGGNSNHHKALVSHAIWVQIDYHIFR